MTETEGPRPDPSRPEPGRPQIPAAAEMQMTPRHARWWQRISPVWLVPLVALIVSLGIVWHSYSVRGTLVRVTFDNSSGIEAGSTVLKYRDVTVGQVEKVGFSADLGRVEVSIRVDQQIAPYIDSDAQFWIVRPEVSVRGVTGLNTVLSGAYIAGSWDSQADEAETHFTGLEQAPLVGGGGEKGLQITLELRDGNQISAGAPMIYRGIEVGSVGAPRLSPDGSRILLDAFIRAPYDKLVTTNTRFWDASGFDVNIGASGVQLDVRSLASLIEGGISFATVVSGGRPVEPGQTFQVFPDQSTARDNVFTAPNDSPLNLSGVFDGSVEGLAEGADVVFNGLRVGKVTDLGAFTEGEGANRRVRMLANMELSSGKLGLGEEATPEEALAALQDFVSAKKLRARLTTGSMFTGSLIVELTEVPDAPDASIDMAAEPYPAIPTAAAEISDFAANSQGVFQRLNALPIEELMKSAIGTLDAVRGLAESPDMRRVPGSAADLLEDTRKLINSDEIAQTLSDLRDVAGQARGVMDRLAQGQAVENLVSAIEGANVAIGNLGTASQDFPEIAGQLRGLSGKLNGLPVEELAQAATRLVNSANAFIDQDAARSLPPALNTALDEVARFLGELRQGGAVANANTAISAAAEAANSINAAAQTLPALSERLSQLAANANSAVSGYGADSRFNTQLVATLRDVQRAAANLAAVAKMLERKPNSLILGR